MPRLKLSPPRCSIVCWLALFAIMGLTPHARLGAEETKAPATGRELPQMVKLEIFPKELALSSERDIQGVIVTGSDAAGLTYDLTHASKLSVMGTNAVLDKDDFLVPKEAGQTELVAKYGDLE